MQCDKRNTTLLAFCLAAVVAAGGTLAGAVTVSNVTVTPTGTGTVDVTYDLDEDAWVSMRCSTDDGAQFDTFAAAASGGVNRVITAGTGHVIHWDGKTDLKDRTVTGAQVRVYAGTVPKLNGQYPSGQPYLTFQMGNPGQGVIDAQALNLESVRESELPVHEVRLTPFYIGRYEVTNQEARGILNWAAEQGYLKNEDPSAYSGGARMFTAASNPIQDYWLRWKRMTVSSFLYQYRTDRVVIQ